MRTIMLIPILFIMSCGLNEVSGNGQTETPSNASHQIDQKDLSMDDTCSIYPELEALRKALFTKNVKQIASYFDLPINDQNILAFVSSQETEQDQQVTIQDLSDFEKKFDKIFPEEYLSHFKNVNLDERGKGEYAETNWENTYGKGHVLLERHRLLYKVERDLVSFRFEIEHYEEEEKYESVIEYFFKFNNCKLKFDKSIIAG